MTAHLRIASDSPPCLVARVRDLAGPAPSGVMDGGDYRRPGTLDDMTNSTAPARRAPSWLGLAPFLLAVALVAVVGGLAAGGAQGTYSSLDLPPYAPPSWLFGPVWTGLYVMIGVAGWLLWRAEGWGRALTLWTGQLILNLGWTPLFFAAGRYGWALVEIVVLALVLVATIAASWRVSRIAAWLLIPYLVWVSFATALNAGIVVLN